MIIHASLIHKLHVDVCACMKHANNVLYFLACSFKVIWNIVYNEGMYVLKAHWLKHNQLTQDCKMLNLFWIRLQYFKIKNRVLIFY